MTARFDENGNLWLEVIGGRIPEQVARDCTRSFRPLPGRDHAGNTVTEINLTAYLHTRHEEERQRQLSDVPKFEGINGITYTGNRMPSWVASALTPTSANVSVALKVNGTPESISSDNDLKLQCEHGWTVGRSTAGYESVTGEHYHEVFGSGCSSEGDARICALKHFTSYAVRRKGVLYWRTTPPVIQSPQTGSWTYYMRLLISEAPVQAGVPEDAA